MNELTPEQEKVIFAGQALYGDRWQSALTKALKLSDSRRIRQWITPKGKTSYRPVPPGVFDDLVILLQARQKEINEVLKNLPQ